MSIDVATTEAGQRYASAYAAHYKTKDLSVALELYTAVTTSYPDTQEAEYARSQIQNIVKSVVPKQILLDAHVELIRAHFELEPPSDIEPGTDTPLEPELTS